MSLDLSALAPTDAEMPAIERPGREPKDNPFTAWLAESKDKGTAKAVTVPAESAREVVYLIRAASTRLNIGSRVALADSKGQRCDLATLDKGTDKERVLPVRQDNSVVRGNVKITFQGKTRKARKPAETTAPAVDGTGEVPASS